MRRLTDAILIAWGGASSPPELLTSVFCSCVTGTLLGGGIIPAHLVASGN